MKTATIDILGKKYSGTGETAREAIAAIPYSGRVIGKGLLTVKGEEGERTIILGLMQVKRLFAPNRLSKEIAVKQTAMRFE